jgi:hypothetical protein
MKKNYVTILTICLSVILVFLFIYYNNNELKGKQLMMANRKYEFLMSKNEAIRFNLFLTYSMSCTFVDMELPLNNKLHENFLFRDILSDSITHVLCIPPMFCSSCNEKVLKVLPDIIEAQGAKLKIICSPANVNSVINYCRHKISDKNLYMTKTPIIDMPEGISNIYILGVTDSGQIKSIFLINDNDMIFFDNYLSRFL